MIESTSEINLPNFYELVTTFFTLNPLIPNSHAANTLRTGMDLDSIIDSFGNFGGERLPCFSQASSFCRQVLLLGALQSPSTIGGDADWERQLSVLLRTDNESRQKIRKHLSTFLSDAPPDCDSSLPTFLNAAFDGMIWNNGEGLGDCGNSFVEIASLSPEESLDNVAPRVLELLPSIISNDIAIRSTAAQAMGILCAHSTNGQSKIEEVLSLLLSIVEGWKSAIGAELNKVHGAVLTVGFVMSRAVFYHRTRTMHSLRDQYLPRAVNLIVGIIQEGNDKSSKDAAYTAFGMLAIAGWISGQAVDNEGISKVKDALSADAKKGNEKAISALGRYAFISDDDRMSELLKVLYDLHELKQPEIHFAIGEALAVACAGWKSDSLSLAFDVDSDYEGPEGETSVLIGVLEKLLRDCKQTKPSLKKASGIWLFSLIQYCGHLPEVQSRLPQCQATFMNLLSARDDLVQETASRGLSLVYEQGDKALQERLVADLVASFTGGSTKIKVDEETELFEPGALPTGNGESVTSYKDIMNLAAEVGDQSLVYKFMSLASNAATWSTRAAFGRFGLSNILSESAVDPKVYPKLYRYRFDPNPNVQRSMNDIWSALVKSPSKTIRDNFDPIVTDLLKNILGKEWRTREASCAAIADLVQTSRFEECEKFLPQIWEVAFKVLDDIKGSVRKAAEKLCKVLTGILIRQLESGSESVHARAMLKEVMPFLFSTRGLESSSKEVQAFALMTVLKLTKKGGKLLLPYIPLVVENILGLLSTLEPDYVNYIHMNAAKYDTTADKIDAARSNAISRSPLMEAVERCLDLVDDETMRSLAPQLHRVIKSAVGMPSKMGCCGALSSLATRHQAIFKPYANDFLKLMQKAVLDRNPTVSAGYAHAAGYISRLASDEQILKIEAFSRELYFNAESETNRQVAAEIIFSISKCATDRFNALSSAFLPFVFFAKHDFDEHVKEQFTKTWDENVGGSRAVLLYLKDIINICLESLPSAKWTVKHTAALTIADVVESAGSVIDIADQKIVWPALEKALLLKTFDGKEKVLDAFVTFTKSSKAFWSEDAAVAAAMTKAAVREAKRTNESYRPHAFRALGDYAAARTDIGLFGEVYNVVKSYFDEVLDEDGDQDKMDIDEDKKTASRTTMTITAGIGALFKAAGGDTVSHLPQLRDRTKAVFKSAKADINTKTVVYEQTKQLFSTDAAKVADGSILWDFFDLLELPSGAGGELSRTKRAEAAAALLKAAENAFGDVGAKEEVVGKMRSQIAEALRHERSYTVKKVLEAVFFER